MPIPLPANATPTLASVDRAVLNGTLATLAASSPAALLNKLAEATGMIQRHCKRDFFPTVYSEYYDGGGMPYQLLMLRQFPLTSIDRIAAYPRTVLTVKINNTVTYQRGTVQTVGSLVRLTSVASGVKAVHDTDTTAYVTIAAVATQINLQPGWTATATPGYELFPSADLNPTQGAFDARTNAAPLELHTEELPNLGGTGDAWCSSGPHGWRCDLECGEVLGRFPPGTQNIRVDYTAGFTPIPDQVQEACVMLAQDLYQNEGINRAVKSESVGPFRYENAANNKAMSAAVMNLLETYIAIDKSISR